MILIIDNYDSFTYNLFQCVGTLEPDILVYRNDKITVQDTPLLILFIFRRGSNHKPELILSK